MRSGENKGEQVNNVFHFHETANVTIDHPKQEVNDMSSKTNVQFGDGATIHGDFVVANKIQDSFNKADSSDVSENLKELLKELALSVGKMAEELPKEEAEQVANDLQAFTNEVTSEKPRQRWWELSADGIKKAAKTVGEIGISVLKNLDTIIPLIGNIG